MARRLAGGSAGWSLCGSLKVCSSFDIGDIQRNVKIVDGNIALCCKKKEKKRGGVIMSRNLGSIDYFFKIKQKMASCSQGHAGKEQGWSLREPIFYAL